MLPCCRQKPLSILGNSNSTTTRRHSSVGTPTRPSRREWMQQASGDWPRGTPALLAHRERHEISATTDRQAQFLSRKHTDAKPPPRLHLQQTRTDTSGGCTSSSGPCTELHGETMSHMSLFTSKPPRRARNKSKPLRRSLPWGTRQLRDETEIASLLANYTRTSPWIPLPRSLRSRSPSQSQGAEVKLSAKAAGSEGCAGPR